MSNTTGRDLLARAERLALTLAHCEQPVGTEAWESFDTTAYRLLREVIGPARSDSGAAGPTRAALLHAIHSYPTPLRPPLDTVLSAQAAERFVPGGGKIQFRREVLRGGIPATRDGDTYEIHSRVVDRRPDIAPPDPTDPHPLARLTTTLGVLADLISQERRHPRPLTILDDTTATDTTIRILSYASVAARYTLRHGPVVDRARPLVVAQYAERSIDILGRPGPATGLDVLAARIPTTAATLNERLDTAIHYWSTACRAELSRTVPATRAMANIADTGALMLATKHYLSTRHPNIEYDQMRDLTEELKSCSDALKGASRAWKTVTTMQPQSREFGAASLHLFAQMRHLITASRAPEQKLELVTLLQALRSVERGIEDLTCLITQARDATNACLNSNLLLAPARALPTTRTRLIDRQRAAHVPLTPKDGTTLLTPLWDAAKALEALTAHQPPARAPSTPLTGALSRMDSAPWRPLPS